MPRSRSCPWIRHRKSPARCRHAAPAGLSNAKSDDAAKAGTTQHSPTQRAQSARSSRVPPSMADQPTVVSVEAGEERVQRRVVAVLGAAQVAGGVGIGAAVSVGALLALDLTGSAAWAGIASTGTTLGAALAAVPLARLAVARGRRLALSGGWLLAAGGAALAVVAASARSFPLYLVALVFLGVGSAANLQARFAATDLAPQATRARSLGLVVWATTVGAVAGPNLTRPGAALAGVVGVPPLAGPLLLCSAFALLAALVLLVALRPDPLLTARAAGRARLH